MWMEMESLGGVKAGAGEDSIFGVFWLRWGGRGRPDCYNWMRFGLCGFFIDRASCGCDLTYALTMMLLSALTEKVLTSMKFRK